MSHSVPDAVGIALETAAGRVFHSGDWKLDHTPIDGLRTDVGKLAELGNRGVDLLLGDSTNAERPGVTESERVVGEAFRQIIPARHGRVLISSFASNIHRMQQAIDVAVDVDRQVRVIGRSMRKNLNIARSLGYIDAPDHVLVRPADLDDVPPEQAADPLHWLAGRAAFGPHPDRLPRPPGDPDRPRRHGDHLRAAGARERAARPRLDQPADAERGGGAARGERLGARLRACARRGAAHPAQPRAPEGRDADPRRVPNAGGARTARAGCRRAGFVDPDRRERRRGRALAGRRADRRPRRGGHDLRRRPRRRRHLRRRAPRPPPPVRGRRPDRRDDARERQRRRRRS